MIKVGDKVRVTSKARWLYGECGIVKWIRENRCAVEFEKSNNQMHYCNGKTQPNRGLWLSKEDLEKIYEPKLNEHRIDDVMKVVDEKSIYFNKIGRLRAVSEKDKMLYIEFERRKTLNDSRFGWFNEEQLKNLSYEERVERNVQFVVDGETITALDPNTGRKGVARCHPDDHFNFNIGSRLAFERLLESEKAIHTFDEVIIANRDEIMCKNVLLASEMIKGIELAKFRYGDRNFFKDGDTFEAICKRNDVWLVTDKEGGYTLVKESGLRKCREEK